MLDAYPISLFSEAADGTKTVGSFIELTGSVDLDVVNSLNWPQHLYHTATLICDLQMLTSTHG